MSSFGDIQKYNWNKILTKAEDLNPLNVPVVLFLLCLSLSTNFEIPNIKYSQFICSILDFKGKKLIKRLSNITILSLKILSFSCTMLIIFNVHMVTFFNTPAASECKRSAGVALNMLPPIPKGAL